MINDYKFQTTNLVRRATDLPLLHNKRGISLYSIFFEFLNSPKRAPLLEEIDMCTISADKLVEEPQTVDLISIAAAD
jgi:hypothetical protein